MRIIYNQNTEKENCITFAQPEDSVTNACMYFFKNVFFNTHKIDKVRISYISCYLLLFLKFNHVTNTILDAIVLKTKKWFL